MKHLNKWSITLGSLFSEKSQGGVTHNAANRRFNPLLFIGLLILLLFGNRASHAQTTNPGWQLLRETTGVKVYYMITTCAAQEVVFFKLSNTNAADKKIIWIASVDGSAQTVSPLGIPPRILQGGGEILSDCNNASQQLSLPVVAGFQISDLQSNLIVL